MYIFFTQPFLNLQVCFKHPKYDKHEVRCKSVETARKWLEEYVEQGAANDNSAEKEVLSAKPRIPGNRTRAAAALATAQRKRKMLGVDKKAHKEQVQLFYALNQVS